MRQFSVILVLCFCGAAYAHPVPQLEFDRQIAVEFQPGKVVVQYRVELDLFTLFHEVGKANSLYKLDLNEIKTREDFAKAMQLRLKKVVPAGFHATFDGQPLKWELDKDRVEFLDSVQFHFRFSAPIPKTDGKHLFRFEELNFPDKNGRIRMSLDSPVDAKILAYTEPVGRKVAPLDNKKNLLEIEYELPVLQVHVPQVKEEAKPVEVDSPVVDRMPSNGLAGLLDSKAGIVWLLMLAAVFGAAHALTPGHGKTLVAAYLVGEQGTSLHAILLGLITTISHTGGVIAVALVLWVFYPDTAPDSVRQTLGFIGGLLIAGLGLWLLLQRLAGKADHVHLPGLSHSHGEAPPADKPFSWTRLVLLGITGGLIPCWDAVLLLGVAISMHKMWLAVPLLVAFSAGLAAVLVVIGLGVVYAGQKLGGKWAENRWVKALPAISAALVIGIGLWLCKASVS